MAALEAREAHLTTEVLELLKQNGKLLEAERENRVEVDALRKELGQVQKPLEDAKLRLVELEGLQEKLDELKGKAAGLKVEMGELKTKVSKAKKVDVVEVKKLDTCKLALNCYPVP